MFPLTRYSGVVVVTCASHAKGPQFNPGWKQVLMTEFDNVNNIYFINSNKKKQGCSSNGRAPTQHLQGTGIDALLLQFLFS